MAIVDADLIAAVRGVIDTQFGAIPSGLDSGQQAQVDSARQKLAIVVAKAAQYVRDFGDVKFPIPVQVDTGTGAGGTTAPGVIE